MNESRLCILVARRLQMACPVVLGLLWAVFVLSCKAQKDEAPEPIDPNPSQVQPGQFAPGLAYTNYRYADVPWSLHVVKVTRSNPTLELHSVHAEGGVGAVSVLSQLMRSLPEDLGEPMAGINGDFYARDRSAYSGDPRGLQIVNGELISAPVGGVAFWIAGDGSFHTTNITSRFAVTLPNGTSLPFGLNEARGAEAVLYTPAMGRSTFTSGGRELILEHGGTGPWLPLKVGETFTGRVRGVRERGNTPIEKDIMVLSMDLATARKMSGVETGATLRFSTATIPHLRGAKAALSGGPVLVRDGDLQRVKLPGPKRSLPYEFRSMIERHPRSAIGWNARQFFLIQVDGRQPGLSMGMTLEELGSFAIKKLGCTHAMNLDGGVSATLWANGRVRNSPANRGRENPIANALVVVRRNQAVQTGVATKRPATAAAVE